MFLTKNITSKPPFHFGASITSLGDINGDGKADIAVGAPYIINKDAVHKNTADGAVYIFAGSETGLEQTQVITAQEIVEADHKMRSNSKLKHSDNKLLGFGFSLASSGLNLDNTASSDLVVGSLADSIVMLRSRPIIDFEVTNDSRCKY